MVDPDDGFDAAGRADLDHGELGASYLARWSDADDMSIAIGSVGLTWVISLGSAAGGWLEAADLRQRLMISFAGCFWRPTG